MPLDLIMSKKVSIIVPCYNEQATIHLLLEALYRQTYPHQALEVVIADGGSTDGTQSVIKDWQSRHPDLTIKLIENSKRTIPSALNAAIAASSGEVIVRLDAHSEPDREYVDRAVTALIAGLGENVGGVWDIRPSRDHWMAQSIAVAAAHPIGVGDARYRYSDQAGAVDTVPFGAFHRHLLDRVGMFDETLLSNEDYEFNTRIRRSGGKIWFDPQIRSVYYARGDLASLAKQYWRYGFWKWQMLRRYPGTIRWRQALPPLFMSTLVVLTLLTLFITWMGWVLIAILGFYIGVLLVASLQLAIKHRYFAILAGVPLAIATMHFSWGAGFLWSILHPQKTK